MYETIIVNEENNRYEIVLNRPEKLNALTENMVLELHDALITLKKKPPKILLIKGAGTSFCSGQDLNEASFTDSEKEFQTFLTKLQEITMFIVNFPAPVISAIQGYALGAGLEIAMNSDLIYTSEDALFGFPELDVGLSITQGSSYFLPKKTGLMKAKELLFFGDKFTAEEAKDFGLVNQVFKKDSFTEEVNRKLDKLSEKSILSLQATRKLLNNGSSGTMGESLKNEVNTLIQLVSSKFY